MGTTRATLIAALRQDPPDTQAALAILDEVDEAALTPDALTLRTALLDAAHSIEAKEARPYDLAKFLRDAANGRLAELDDHEIDFDLPDAEDPHAQGLAALATPLPPRPGAIPGPDTFLLEALRQRDALVARRIAGDTPSETDMDAYHQALVKLGQALAPLVDAHTPLDTTAL